MASSTPPSSGRNSPIPVDTSQADQTQDTSTSSGQVPIVQVSASSDVPATTTSTTAGTGGASDTSSSPVLLTLHTYPYPAYQGAVTQTGGAAPVPVAQRDATFIRDCNLTPVMLERSGFSSSTASLHPNLTLALASFIVELPDDAILYFRAGPGGSTQMHASNYSVYAMENFVDAARDARTCDNFIRMFDSRELTLLSVEEARQILQQDEDASAAAALPIVRDRRDSRDRDPDLDGAGASSLLTGTSEPSEPLYSTVQKDRTAPPVESRTSSQPASSLSPTTAQLPGGALIERKEPTYVEVGEFS
ncbi:MAG: hypothetical protein ACRC9R_10425, partial [Enterovibrio sp.]